MGILHNAFKTSVWQRKLVAILAISFVFTSSRVQAAEVNTVISPQAAQAISQAVEPSSGADGLVLPPAYFDDPADAAPVISVETVKPTPSALKKTYRVAMTSYNSVPGQTDGSPFITADGSCVREGIVAANFLRIGTKIRIPSLFGDRVFEVRDRMNERYTYRVDVWMKDIRASKQFGIKRSVTIEVVEEGTGKKSWDQKNTNAGCQKLALGT